ncbi:hypothetical protein GDO81_009505 [Engystomops pustulosus]|uniref:Uncharacterized protein n=1 Tax=Engystomops pustulosus TaxID=76066 RepID=A0AAV7BRG6_ENGPU|nr:hypothetical protein GDO81_009505 [Engystomops pustulosus]
MTPMYKTYFVSMVGTWVVVKGVAKVEDILFWLSLSTANFFHKDNCFLWIIHGLALLLRGWPLYYVVCVCVCVCVCQGIR